jgi:hypothetical protein
MYRSNVPYIRAGRGGVSSLPFLSRWWCAGRALSGCLRSYISAYGNPAGVISASRIMARTDPPLASAVLADLPRTLPPDPRLQDLVVALGKQGAGILLVIASLASIPPSAGVPTGFVFGAVLVLVAAGMMAGHGVPRLPRRLGRIRLGPRLMATLIRRGVPLLRRIERRSTLRLLPLVEAGAAPWLGVVVALMGVLIILPIPFGNTVPALAVVFIGLGLALHDGGAVAAGLGVAALALAISTGLIFLAYEFVRAAFG